MAYKSRVSRSVAKKTKWQVVLGVGAVLLVVVVVGNGLMGGRGSLQKPMMKPVLATDQSLVLPYELDWRLRLVNQSNPLPADFTVETKKLANGKAFDARAIDDLQAMLDQADLDGIDLLVVSAHRTMDYQVMLINKKVNYYINQGYTEEEAYNIAKTIVAVPGTSEHNLGLAADIVCTTYQTLDSGFEQTDAFAWLKEHAWEYGFILRFPADKQEITGIIYEPWHYRYVGRDRAKEISAEGICLEEWWANQKSK